jgi:hypothetical protein
MDSHPLETSRQIVERWVIEGELILQSPTHLGNGDSDGLVDMPLLLDEATGRAILTGTSLAGALRNYLREWRHGFGASPQDNLVESLFGTDKGNDQGSQSALIVDDAVGGAPKIELRDGVRIDPTTRTAKIDFDGDTMRGYKYDLQLLEAGIVFPIRLELQLSTGAARPCQRRNRNRSAQAARLRRMQGQSVARNPLRFAAAGRSVGMACSRPSCMGICWRNTHRYRRGNRPFAQRFHRRP